MTKLAEIKEAILQLNPNEQQMLQCWLDETTEETPEMLTAIDEGLHSLAIEGGVPIEEARHHLRQWISTMTTEQITRGFYGEKPRA